MVTAYPLRVYYHCCVCSRTVYCDRLLEYDLNILAGQSAAMTDNDQEATEDWKTKLIEARIPAAEVEELDSVPALAALWKGKKSLKWGVTELQQGDPELNMRNFRKLICVSAVTINISLAELECCCWPYLRTQSASALV